MKQRERKDPRLQDLERQLDGLHDDLRGLWRQRVNAYEGRMRRLEGTEEGWAEVERYMEANGCGVRDAMNALIGTPPERPKAPNPTDARGVLLVDGTTPLWEEPAPSKGAPSGALADDGGDGFEGKVRALTDQGIDRDAAITELCNRGELAW